MSSKEIQLLKERVMEYRKKYPIDYTAKIVFNGGEYILFRQNWKDREHFAYTPKVLGIVERQLNINKYQFVFMFLNDFILEMDWTLN